MLRGMHLPAQLFAVELLPLSIDVHEQDWANTLRTELRLGFFFFFFFLGQAEPASQLRTTGGAFYERAVTFAVAWWLSVLNVGLPLLPQAQARIVAEIVNGNRLGTLNLEFGWLLCRLLWSVHNFDIGGFR